jgi:diguanylate cyclase (GGDEF)-like protein
MLEQRLYRIILATAFLMSVVSLVGNLIAGFPILLNVKWFVLAAISAFAFLYQWRRGQIEWPQKLFFIFVILFFLPFAYMQSGGSANNTLGYEFLILISLTYLFKGRWRLTLVLLHIVVFMGMATIEYLKPEWIEVYSRHTQYVDRVIQIPLLMLASFFIIKLFADAYDKNKEMQKTYSAELEKANEQLLFLANYDELTGLYNRRAFNLKLDQFCKRRNEVTDAHSPAYIVLIDLDNFKKINDTKGHLTGDAVLSEFGKVLLSAVKPPHIVSRWGGDEFSLIFFGEEEKLLNLVKLLKSQYETITEKHGVASGLSVGAVGWECPSEALDVLIAADQALYESKVSSNRQIVISTVLEKKCF